MAETTTTQSSGLDPKVAGLLAWLFAPLSSIIFLVIEKENKLVKFHAWESMIAMIGAWVIVIVLSVVMTFTIILACLAPLLFFIPFVLAIIGAIKAYQGEMWKLPWVGDFAEKQASN